MSFVPAHSSFARFGHMAMQQHPYYATTIEALGGRAKFYYCSDGSAEIAQIQVIQRRFGPLKLAWVPRGPVWAGDVENSAKLDVLARLTQALPKGTLRILTPDNPEDTDLLRDMRFRQIAPGQQFALLDLTAHAGIRLARQHGKWRNRLRHAQAAPVTYSTRPFHPERDCHLLKLEQMQRRRLGYRTLPGRFTQAWASMNRNAAQLFEARDTEGLIAFVLVLIHAPTASYHIGWSNSRGRAFSCHNQLLWQSSNWLAERDIQQLDLGLIDGQTMPGLTRFKLGIGAKIHQSGPTLFCLPQLRLSSPWPKAA